MAEAPTTISEADILARVIDAADGDLPQDLARRVLSWEFPSDDRNRMDTLAEKSREDTLTEVEREEMECYMRVGSFVSIMKSKARLSLQKNSPAS